MKSAGEKIDAAFMAGYVVGYFDAANGQRQAILRGQCVKCGKRAYRRADQECKCLYCGGNDVREE